MRGYHLDADGIWRLNKRVGPAVTERSPPARIQAAIEYEQRNLALVPTEADNDRAQRAYDIERARISSVIARYEELLARKRDQPRQVPAHIAAYNEQRKNIHFAHTRLKAYAAEASAITADAVAKARYDASQGMKLSEEHFMATYNQLLGRLKEALESVASDLYKQAARNDYNDSLDEDGVPRDL